MDPQKSLHPKHHIFNKQQLSSYECNICYQLSPETFRCQGPCHKPFCSKCISQVKQYTNSCPHKCSQTFEIQPIPEFQVQYSCPFHQCSILMETVEEFTRHYQECPHLTPEAEAEIVNQRNFQCNKGHPLDLMTPHLLMSQDMDEFFQAVMNQNCKSCGDSTLCRAICMTCTEGSTRHSYCVECRKYPFIHSKCKFDHFYKDIEITSELSMVCDVCGKAGLYASFHGAFDQVCNVFICSLCYINLPAETIEESQTTAEICN